MKNYFNHHHQNELTRNANQKNNNCFKKFKITSNQTNNAPPYSGNRRMSERDLTRMGADCKNSGGPLIANNHLANSKSVPALHHHMGSGTICKFAIFIFT